MFQKKRQCAGYLFLLFVTVMLPVTLFEVKMTGQTMSTSQALTNDTVQLLLKLGLNDDTIALNINNSDNVFLDASDSALLSLKRLGASDRIIELIRETSAAKTKMTADSTGLPSSEGFYVSDDQALVKLQANKVDTIVGLSSNTQNFVVDGLRNPQGKLHVSTRTPIIILYQQGVNIEDIRVSLMSFLKEMPAKQFDIEQTDAQSFKDIYSKSPEETIAVNLRCPVQDVEMRVEPVEAKSGMYRLTPVEPLKDGYYAIYASGTLHSCNTAFRMSGEREQFTFGFLVEGGEKTIKISGQSGDDPAKLVGLWLPEKTINHDSFPEKDISFFSNGLLIADAGMAGVYVAKNGKLIMNMGQTHGTYIYDYQLQGSKLTLAGYGGKYVYKRKSDHPKQSEPSGLQLITKCNH